jgi:hypothetical protein
MVDAEPVARCVQAPPTRSSGTVSRRLFAIIVALTLVQFKFSSWVHYE